MDKASFSKKSKDLVGATTKNLNRKKLLLTIILCLLYLLCDSVFAWGSLTSTPIGMAAPSHQYILRCANESLSSDPAYEGSNFPKLEEMLQFEGVEVDGWGAKSGRGPDDSSPYSGHNYNPWTKKGDAPAAAANWYDKLKDHLLLGQDAAQDAAYLAHYVADISCPYHINGMLADEALKLKPTEKSTGGKVEKVLKLPSGDSADSVTGLLLPRGSGPMGGSTSVQITGWSALLGGLPGSVIKRGHCGSDGSIDGANWRLELDNWKKIYNKSPEVADWFDPWYSDGVAKEGYEESSSTHTFWELYAFENCSPVHDNKVVKATSYSPRFAQNGNGNKKNIDNFIKEIANETRKHQGELLLESTEGKPDKSLDENSNLFFAYKRAIEDVYTAWRASFSALRPEVSLKLGSKPGSKNVVVKIKNLAYEKAENINIDMELLDSRCFRLEKTKNYPTTISGNVAGKPGELKIDDVWEIVSKEGCSAEKEEKVKIKLEVTGVFKTTPDSGKAVLVTEPFTEGKQEEVSFIVFRWTRPGGTDFTTGQPWKKQRQYCQNFLVAIYDSTGTYVDGGESIARNGDFTTSLFPGEYKYTIQYKYTRPVADSGSKSGKFKVAKEGRNMFEVETPPAYGYTL